MEMYSYLDNEARDEELDRPLTSSLLGRGGGSEGGCPTSLAELCDEGGWFIWGTGSPISCIAANKGWAISPIMSAPPSPSCEGVRSVISVHT